MANIWLKFGSISYIKTPNWLRSGLKNRLRRVKFPESLYGAGIYVAAVQYLHSQDNKNIGFDVVLIIVAYNRRISMKRSSNLVVDLLLFSIK